MNIQSTGQTKNKPKSHWILFTLYLIFIYSTELFYRKPLFEFSLTYIENLQGQDPKKNGFFLIAELVSHMGNGVMMPIVILVYNFANIYKTLILLFSLLLSTMHVSILKMIYSNPRPYWMNDKIVSFDCEAGWGNPSGHSLASTAFYLTLWHIIFDCSQLREKKTTKYVSLGFTIFFILLIMFSRNLLGAHSINQIIFGFLIGFSIYFFLFFVLDLKLNDSRQFGKILEFRNLIYGVINFFIFLFAILLYFFNRNDENFAEFDKRINGQCANVTDSKRLHNESLITFAIFLSNMGAFIGLKFEYHFTFEGNIKNWSQYNFELDEREDDESLMTKITINKETQWNHTNSFFSFMRMFIILLIISIIVLPYYLIKWEDNFVVVFMFKVLFPANCVTFSLFYLIKTILKSLRMVNLTLYSMLQDSL